jgi:hypothetical protein
MVGDVVCVLSCEVLTFIPNCFWDTPLTKEKEKEKTTQAAKTTPHIN